MSPKRSQEQSTKPKQAPERKAVDLPNLPPDFKIQFVSPAGVEIALDPPPQVTDTVEEIRCRLGLELKIHPKRVSLLWGPEEIPDEGTIAEVAASNLERASTGTMTLTLVRLRCQARPSEYSSYLTHTDAAFQHVATVEFPEPKDRNINMMPFIIGMRETLPEDLWGYWPLVESCPVKAEFGRIGYLTVHEGLVPEGQSQRRPGLHTETPGLMLHGGHLEEDPPCWGLGMAPDRHLVGGIYMASTVSDSCAIWPYLVQAPEEICGDHGDIEHLRDFLEDEERPAAGELVWMTDRTPHESLPLEEESYRQYFRFVTSDVSVWFAKHSTPNPLGIEPDPKRTKIITYDKFKGPGPDDR